MKRVMLVLSALAVFGFVFGGCKKDKPAEPAPPPADEAQKDEPPPPPDEAKKEEPKEEAKADEAAKGDNKIGVPECDEYISKYSKCIGDKAPDAVKEQMKKAFDTAVDGWKKAAATEAGKAALANGCKMALDAAKKSSEAWGCEW